MSATHGNIDRRGNGGGHTLRKGCGACENFDGTRCTLRATRVGPADLCADFKRSRASRLLQGTMLSAALGLALLVAFLVVAGSADQATVRLVGTIIAATVLCDSLLLATVRTVLRR